MRHDTGDWAALSTYGFTLYCVVRVCPIASLARYRSFAERSGVTRIRVVKALCVGVWARVRVLQVR